MMTRPAVMTDSELASWRRGRDGRRPPTAATDSALRDAARFVISPDGHADDARLQSTFKLLRAEAPVLWLDTPGIRPFWLLSRHGDISTVERRGAPFTAAPRTFLSSRMAEERLERILGKPYVLRGLLQMDDPDHAAYRAVAQPWLAPAALAEVEEMQRPSQPTVDREPEPIPSEPEHVAFPVGVIPCTSCQHPQAAAALREVLNVYMAACRGEPHRTGSTMPRACCQWLVQRPDARALIA